MRTRNNLTEEQKEFLLEVCRKYKANVVCDMFYKKFGIRKTQGVINSFRRYHNIKYDCFPLIKTEEQKEFLIKILTYHNNKETIEIFKKKYGYCISEKSLHNYRQKYKIKKKYKQYDKNNNMVRTNKKPLYSEYINPNRNVYIRIGKKRKVKTRFVWEQYYGREVPKGYDIIFADGNKNNFDINNLVVAKRSVRIFMQKNEIKTINKEIADTSRLILNLKKKMVKKEI